MYSSANMYYRNTRMTYENFIKDVRDQADYDSCIDMFLSHFGGIDHFIYCPEDALSEVAKEVHEYTKHGFTSIPIMEFLTYFFSAVKKTEKEFKFLDELLDKYFSDIPSGEMIGFKKAVLTGGRGYAIVTLRIPEDAKRSKAFGSKWRCDKAFVIAIIPRKCNKSTYICEHHNVAVSGSDPEFFYKKGEWVSVDNFEECRWLECAPGIHFFTDEAEAIAYYL